MAHSWLVRHPRLVDWALFLCAPAQTLVLMALSDERVDAVVLMLVISLPLLYRRRWPLAVLVLTTAACSVATVLGWAPYSGAAPVAIALFAVANHCPRHRSLRTGAGVMAVMVVTRSLSTGLAPTQAVRGLVVCLIAWLVGDGVAMRRRYLKELEGKVTRLEHVGEDEAVRAVAEQRASPSRQVEDVVADNPGVVVIQAAVGKDVFSGFLLKTAQPADLVDAGLVGPVGRELPGLAATDHLIAGIDRSHDPAAARALETLTARERETLRLLASGFSNVELARELGVSETTVKTHVSAVFRKLGVRDRVQAVIAAYDTGLVTPGG